MPSIERGEVSSELRAELNQFLQDARDISKSVLEEAQGYCGHIRILARGGILGVKGL